nr:uncharacterized protein CI109_000255 [Kwoniella shandongensis]KAA5531414.1 hypothetical protein CI109_000255 [Kwoniella shandongensis]
MSRTIFEVHTSTYPELLEASSLEELRQYPKEDNGSSLSYDKLVYLGGKLLDSIANIILQDLFPSLSVTDLATISSRLIGDESLAQIANAYDLEAIVAPGDRDLNHQQASERAEADLLRAYIAGVFYSYTTCGQTSTVEKIVLAERNLMEDQVVFDRFVGEGFEPRSLYKKETTLIRLESSPTPTPSIRDGEVKLEINDDDSEDDLAATTLPPILEPRRIDIDLSRRIQGKKEAETQSHTADLENMIKSMMSMSPSPQKPSSIPLVQQRQRASSVRCPDSIPIKQPDAMISLGSSMNPFTSAFEPSSPFAPPVTSPSLTIDPVLSYRDSPSTFDRPTMERGRTNGQAYDHLLTWLTPLLTPLAQQSPAKLATDTVVPLPPTTHLNSSTRSCPSAKEKEEEEEDQQAVGGVQALNQHPLMIGSEHKPVYRKSQVKKGEMWKVVCTVVDKHGSVW